MADAAADADDFRLKSIDYVDNTSCNIIDILVNNCLGGPVVKPHCVKGCPAVDIVNVVIYKLPHGAVMVMAHSVLGL